MLNFRKRKESPAEEDLPLNRARYVVIDTELTGLDEKKDSIVSMAAIRMTGGAIDLENIFTRVVNPASSLSAESVVIHGITPSETAGKPSIEDALSEFARFCRDDLLVGHCVSIDLTFINKEMKRAFGSGLGNPALDTSAIYAWIVKRSPEKAFPRSFSGSGLYEIASYFGIPVSGAHDAVMDAFITAQVFQRFIPILIERGVEDVGDLLRIGHPSRGGENGRLSGEMYGL